MGSADARPVPLGAARRRARRRIGGPAPCWSRSWGSSRAASCGRSRRRSSSRIRRSTTGAGGGPGSGCRRCWKRSGRRSSGETPSWPGCGRRGSTRRTGGAASCRCSVPRGSARRAWWPSWPARSSAPEVSCCTPGAATPAPGFGPSSTRRSARPGLSLDELDGVPVGELGATVMQVLATESHRPAGVAGGRRRASGRRRHDRGARRPGRVVRTPGRCWSSRRFGPTPTRRSRRCPASGDVRRPPGAAWPRPRRAAAGLRDVRGGGLVARRRRAAPRADRRRAAASSTSWRASGPGSARFATSERRPTARPPRTARLAGLRAEIAQSVEGIQHVLEQRRANIAPRQAERSGGDDSGGERRPAVQGALRVRAERRRRLLRSRATGRRARRPTGRRSTAGRRRPVGQWQVVARAGRPAAGAGVWRASGDRWLDVADRDTADAARPARRAQRGHQPAVIVRRRRRLVFVDQFEELFTDGHDRNEQAAFVDDVVAVANRPDSAVVLAVRADHLDRCASFPELAELIVGQRRARRADARRRVAPGDRAAGATGRRHVRARAGRRDDRRRRRPPGRLAAAVDGPCRDLGTARRRRAHAQRLHVGRWRERRPRPPGRGHLRCRSDRSSNRRPAGC